MNMFKLEGRFGKCALAVLAGHMQVADVEETVETVEEIGEDCGTINQIFDASRIAGKEHLVHAAKLALSAQKGRKSFASSPNMELACWTASSPQINRAIDRVGIRENTQEVALVTLGEDPRKANESQERITDKLQIDPDDKVLEITEKKENIICEIYSISKNELEMAPLKKIMLERVALLSLKQ